MPLSPSRRMSDKDSSSVHSCFLASPATRPDPGAVRIEFLRALNPSKGQEANGREFSPGWEGRAGALGGRGADPAAQRALPSGFAALSSALAPPSALSSAPLRPPLSLLFSSFLLFSSSQLCPQPTVAKRDLRCCFSCWWHWKAEQSRNKIFCPSAFSSTSLPV